MVGVARRAQRSVASAAAAFAQQCDSVQDVERQQCTYATFAQASVKTLDIQLGRPFSGPQQESSSGPDESSCRETASLRTLRLGASVLQR